MNIGYTKMQAAVQQQLINVSLLPVLAKTTILSRASAQPLNFGSFVIFKVLRVTAHHAKICVVNPKVGPLSLHSCNCSDVPRLRHQRFAHTCPWPCSQHSSPAAQNLRTASDDQTQRKLDNEATSRSAL